MARASAPARSMASRQDSENSLHSVCASGCPGSLLSQKLCIKDVDRESANTYLIITRMGLVHFSQALHRVAKRVQ